jgi:ATP-dependent DNA helicase RecG
LFFNDDRLYTENATRGVSDNPITPDDFEPNPKNPLIAAFLRNIGLADELGSGVLKLFKYTRRYSGKDPELLDGDVFRTIVPLDDYFSFDSMLDTQSEKNKTSNKNSNKTSKSEVEVLFIEYVKKHPQATQKEIKEKSGRSMRSIQDGFNTLQLKGVLHRKGAKKNGIWIVKGGTHMRFLFTSDSFKYHNILRLLWVKSEKVWNLTIAW